MTKSAEVCTRLTAHRDCPQPTRPKSYYPKANHQRFRLRTKPAPVAAVEQLRKSGDFFFLSILLICITCSPCLQGHVRPCLFPNLRTKPQRFQMLDSKKETRVHQSFCSVDVLSFCGHLSCLRSTSSGAGECLSEVRLQILAEITARPWSSQLGSRLEKQIKQESKKWCGYERFDIQFSSLKVLKS